MTHSSAVDDEFSAHGTVSSASSSTLSSPAHSSSSTPMTQHKSIELMQTDHTSAPHDQQKHDAVRSLLVDHVDAVLEVAEAEENNRAAADAVLTSAPAFGSPIADDARSPTTLLDVADPSSSTTAATPAPRAALSVGNFLSTYIPPRILGITYLALSAIVFSMQALIVSILSPTLPSFQIVGLRCFCQFAFGWIACYSQGVFVLGPRERWKWLWLRGTTGCVAFSFYYFAIAHMTLGDSTTIFFTTPLYTGFLGYLFLGEAVARFDVACTVISLSGVVMVVRPAFIFGATEAMTNGGSAGGGVDASTGANDPNVNVGNMHVLGVIAALIGAICSACVYIIIRRIGPVSPLVLVSYMGMAGMVIGPLGGIFQTFVWPADAKIWLMVFSVGALSFTGQLLFNAGVQKEKAGPASMIRNLDVVMSFIWQITIESVIPNVWSILGALIISASVVAMGIRKWRMTPATTTSATNTDVTATASATPTSSSSSTEASASTAQTSVEYDDYEFPKSKSEWHY